MPGLDSPTPVGSPLMSGASNEEALSYYKRQYEALEGELADFQQSSRELEAELEKDVEAAELRERQLREKVEALNFEVEEWKAKCKQSKTEANMAQNKLQREITELRDTNRNLQLKLRDMEVQNDDFERQARNTTSSLEDVESKYNQTIERSVILEGEMKAGEQEREALRIEAQRLREELSDLKVEAEIRQEKLRLAEAATEEVRASIHSLPAADLISRPQSSVSEHSPVTSELSPGMATPPAKSVSSATSEDPTIPSPMRTEKAHAAPGATPAPALQKSRLSINNGTTPRPNHYSSRPPRSSARTSIPGPGSSATPAARRTTMQRPDGLGQTGHSSSLSQVRGLITKMQRLEQRVHTARSKLPAPTHTPPRASPRPPSSLSNTYIPSTVTVRSSRKRSLATNTNHTAADMPSESGDASAMPPTPSAGRERPTSRMSCMKANGTSAGYGSSTTGLSRPASRQSLTSRQSISHLPSAASSSSRPPSRQGLSGSKTPLGSYSDSSRLARPRSSAALSHSAVHGARQSISQLSNYGMEESPENATAGGGSARVGDEDVATPTPSRRLSGIPAPVSKRQSLSSLGGAPRRTSKGPGSGELGDMGPPARKKIAEIGETY